MCNSYLKTILSTTLCLVGSLVVSGELANAAQEGEVLVDFEKDIKPIFENHCMSCHGSEDPQETELYANYMMLDFIEPEDADSSELYEYLTTDGDEIMPPTSAKNPLTSAQLALVRIWINNGAPWDDSIELSDPNVAVEEGDEVEAVEEVAQEKSMPERLWAFQGYFHPAAVHFPVALLSVAALFVVLHWIFKSGFRDAAFYCLVIGAISAVAASAMGWSFASERGFGGSVFDEGKTVFWHRWGGVGVSVLAIVVSILAIRAKRSEGSSQTVWQVGTLVVAAVVGWVGHEGGEMTYPHLYEDAFEILSPSDPEEVDAEEVGAEEVGAEAGPAESVDSAEPTESVDSGESEE